MWARAFHCLAASLAFTAILWAFMVACSQPNGEPDEIKHAFIYDRPLLTTEQLGEAMGGGMVTVQIGRNIYYFDWDAVLRWYCRG